MADETSYLYLSDGKLLQIVYDNGTSTVFGYGSNGMVESITDPTGRVTRLTYDTKGNLSQITDPDNTSRGFEYGLNHALISQTDKMSQVKNYAYNARGSVSHSVRPDNSLLGVQAANARLTTEGLGTMDSPFMIGMASDRMSYVSDSQGNAVQIETNEFGAITKRIDAMDGEETFERDKNNNIINSRDKNGHITMSTYDDMGNLTSRMSPRGSSKYAYMSESSMNFHRPVSITDEMERHTDFEYDEFGNVTKITDPEKHITTFTYENNYLLESERNHATDTGKFYEYDANDNLTTIEDIFGQTLSTLTYDTAGNILTQTSALGDTTTFYLRFDE